jgi:hypothetical protein
MLIPDRLPSLILLVGSWVPAAVAGRAAAAYASRKAPGVRPVVIHGAMAVFVLASSAAWFFINVNAMPPYIPGATMDPRYASPEATRALLIFTSAVVVPASAIACWLAFRMRGTR